MTCSSNQVQVRVCHHWHLLSSYSHSLLEANSMSIFLLWQHEHGAYTPVDTYHLSARTPGAFCFALHHHTFFSLNLLIRFNHKTLLGLLLLLVKNTSGHHNLIYDGYPVYLNRRSVMRSNWQICTKAGLVTAQTKQCYSRLWEWKWDCFCFSFVVHLNLLY